MTEEFDLAGIAISLGARAQQGTTVHYKNYDLFADLLQVFYLLIKNPIRLFSFVAVTCYYRKIDSKIPFYM